MTKLLKFDTSPMGDHSTTRKLTADFAQAWLAAHPGGEVVSRDLSSIELPRIEGFWVGAAHAREAERTPEQRAALATSDLLIADLQAADEYVFGVPMHNFGIPASLKLWIDQVARAGKTFQYTANGPVGLLEGKKATLLIASAGVYARGSALASWNFVEPYLRTVLAFMGITDVTAISAEGTAQLTSGKVDPQVFLASTLQKINAHASL